MTGAFNSLERFWSMACAVFSVWKWQRMGSGWGATSYQAGRGSWPMAKGSSGNGSKHGEPVDRENFIALSAQHKLGVNGFKTNVLLLWSGGSELTSCAPGIAKCASGSWNLSAKWQDQIILGLHFLLECPKTLTLQHEIFGRDIDLLLLVNRPAAMNPNASVDVGTALAGVDLLHGRPGQLKR